MKGKTPIAGKKCEVRERMKASKRRTTHAIYPVGVESAAQRRKSLTSSVGRHILEAVQGPEKFLGQNMIFSLLLEQTSELEVQLSSGESACLAFTRPGFEFRHTTNWVLWGAHT